MEVLGWAILGHFLSGLLALFLYTITGMGESVTDEDLADLGYHFLAQVLLLFLLGYFALIFLLPRASVILYQRGKVFCGNFKKFWGKEWDRYLTAIGLKKE